jgi:hypothetical protein
MLGVPYLMLAAGGFVVYRGLRATAKRNQLLAEAKVEHGEPSERGV